MLGGVWRYLLVADVVGSVPFYGPDVVRLAVAEGDDELAAAIMERATRAAGRLRTSTATAAVLRCQGTVHRDPDAFVGAAEAVADNPRPIVWAGAHEDAGRALAAAGRRYDARRHLTAAIAVYERLGFVRDVGRLSAAGRAVGLRRGQRGHRRRPTHGWKVSRTRSDGWPTWSRQVSPTR